MNVLFLLAGFAVLFAGGELLVRGAAGLAIRARISPMIVGLTVVSLGTSAPELFAGLQAAAMGKTDISIGTVVGSNIANLGLVLAVTVLIFPIPVERKVLKQDWPVMIIATVLFYLLAIDRELSILDGVILFALLVSFIVYLVFRNMGRKNRDDVPDKAELKKSAKYKYVTLITFIIAGCFGLYYGSEWFLEGAVGVAQSMGVSDHIIGVTVVAFGTSVPELAASGIAAFRKQPDISLGNLIGSNIFNILGVLGITSIFHNLSVSDQVMSRDFYWMLGIAILVFPIIFVGKKISRLNGIMLLTFYILYVYFLLT